MTVLIVVVGLMIMTSVFLLLQKSILKKLFGIIVLSSAFNITIFMCGRLDSNLAVFLHQGTDQAFSNPLAQALTLTAIVIGFALIAYLCALLKVLLNRKDDEVA